MFRSSASLGALSALSALLLGANDRQRLRVLHSMLGVPALMLIHALLILEWHLGQIDGWPVAWFIILTLAGCGVFYLLVRCGLGERLSREASLSAPQMVYAMVCVAWGYSLAGQFRTAILCLMPLILFFGILRCSAEPQGRWRTSASS